jgi:hypothetical protein
MSEAAHAQTDPRPVSIGLLKRLGQAAMGLVPAGNEYIVASYDPVPPKNRYIIEGFRTRAEAEAYASENGDRDLGIFGPYTGEPGIQAAKRVAEVRLTLVDDDLEVEPISGAEFDAIFWGYPAVEKFVLPYYTSSSGVGVAQELDDEYRKPGTYVLAHSNDTEYTIFKLTEKVSGGGKRVGTLVPIL